MIITVKEIERELRANFSTKYRRFSGFIDSGYLWDLVIKTINDAELMKNIKFCNDIMKIPPIKVFVLAQNPALPDLKNPEKQAVGAVFGFIFKDIFGYTEQESVSCVVNTIKTATRFYNPVGEVIIREEE
jgi:hypothetical protein